MKPSSYKPKHKIRFVTATSLFDGHDASINIMRRILQSSGVEVIHLGHNRSVDDIVTAALQEDVQGIAVSSYQGGHVEYFKYMVDLLRQRGGENIRVFGGGGGVIVPAEIRELHDYGVTHLYSVEDGQKMGLQGMIDDMVRRADVNLSPMAPQDLAPLRAGDRRALARVITALEAGTWPKPQRQALLEQAALVRTPALGITGTGGAGKSSLTDELIRRFRLDQDNRLKIAVVSIDPSRKRTGGALLGDRIRMNAIDHPHIFMRSLATRDAGSEISSALPEVIAACKLAGFDLILVETSGIGQGDAAIVPHVDLSMYVMTPEFGAASQLEKIDMLDFADFVAINKFDRRGAADALRDVRKQYQRNRERFADAPEAMPVFGTQAARFNDDGVTALYQALLPMLAAKGLMLEPGTLPATGVKHSSPGRAIVPAERVRYLAEIAEAVRGYHQHVDEQVRLARERQHLRETKRLLSECGPTCRFLDAAIEQRHEALDGRARKLLEMWPAMKAAYAADEYVVKIRDKEIRTKLVAESLSGTPIRKVVLPRHEDEGEQLKFLMRENVPGSFPFTAGVFAFKRENEDPTRMFAGEGDAFRTNRRFKKLSEGMPAVRLFDRLRLGDPLRLRSRRAAGHLRQDRQLRRVDRHPRRPEGALWRVRPLRADHLGVDDHQRAGADDSGDVLQRGDRPAARQVPRRQRSRADRGRSREDSRMGPVHRARHRAGRHPQGGPGPEHLHLQHRVRPQADGRHPGILRPSPGQELLLGVDLRLPHRRGRRQSHQPVGVHPRQRLHLCRVVSGAWHAHRRLCAQSLLLLQQRHGAGIFGHGPGGAPHLGGGDEEPLWCQRAQPEAQVPHPDLGPQPSRPGDGLQRHPHHAPGADRHLRQLQQPAHQCLRRGGDDADRGERAPGHGHPVDHQPRMGPGQEREPQPGRLHHRRTDRPGRRGGAQGVRGDLVARRRARRDGNRLPARQDPGGIAALRAEEARRLLSRSSASTPSSTPMARAPPARSSWPVRPRRRSSRNSGGCAISSSATATTPRSGWPA